MQNSLADCKVGEEVEVLSIEDDFIATKLIEMGMTENLKTRVVLIAPLGDPIAIDIKGARMYIGSKHALEQEMNNVAFLRTRIEFIESFFDKDEVDEIWITFPDPQPIERRVKKRLTSPLFLDRYLKFLKHGGVVHLKTDSAMLHEYTLQVIRDRKYKLIDASADLYAGKISEYDIDTQEILGIKTHYETLFSEKGFKITYLKFQMN